MCTLDHSTATIQLNSSTTVQVTPQYVFTVGMTVLVLHPLTLNPIIILSVNSVKTEILSRSRLVVQNIDLCTCFCVFQVFFYFNYTFLSRLLLEVCLYWC